MRSPWSPMTVGPLQRLTGRHQLLGWHLPFDDLAFLTSPRADLDVDEYGRWHAAGAIGHARSCRDSAVLL